MHEILSYGVYFKAKPIPKEKLEEIDRELHDMIRKIENGKE